MTTETVARIASHLPCLERAASDPAAAPEVRQVLWEQIARFRVALALLGADLPDVPGQDRMVPDDLVEVGRG